MEDDDTINKAMDLDVQVSCSSAIESDDSQKLSYTPLRDDPGDSKENLNRGARKVKADTEGPLRRSNRDRVSTVVHVNGHTIKKENYYEVKGETYHYTVVNGNQEGELQELKRNQKSKKPAGSDLQQTPRKPRVQSKEELDRLKMKEMVERNRRSKESSRIKFLQEHLHVWEPFCDPNVIRKLREKDVTVGYFENVVAATECTVPQAIQADLRDYQLHGLNWMSQMYSKNCGMILGDEMGLGKSLQTISLVSHLKEKWGCTGPSLIICPMSVLDSWQKEITKWAPSLTYFRLHCSNTEAAALDASAPLNQYDMIVTTYEMTRAPALRRLWSRQHFNLLVLDEGHRIKGIDTQVSQAVRKIHSECRLILTGTPLANNLVELYSLLSFLLPDVFTISQPFDDAFDLRRNQVDPVRLEQAHKVLDKCMLRRLKNEVEKLMPKKIETRVRAKSRFN